MEMTRRRKLSPTTTIIYRQIILTHMNDNRDPDIIMSHENFKKYQKNHKIDKNILNKKITKFQFRAALNQAPPGLTRTKL